MRTKVFLTVEFSTFDRRLNGSHYYWWDTVPQPSVSRLVDALLDDTVRQVMCDKSREITSWCAANSK